MLYGHLSWLRHRRICGNCTLGDMGLICFCELHVKPNALCKHLSISKLCGMRAGLQGCDIATATSRVGTSFNLTFIVFDSHMPAALASLTKSITVISPCSPTQTFCPGSAPVCGAGPCSLRGASAAVTSPTPVATANFTNLPEGSVAPSDGSSGSAGSSGSGSGSIDGTGAQVPSARVRAVCGCQPPALLYACSHTDAAPGCIVRADNTSSVLVQQDIASCPLSAQKAGTCAACPLSALARGSCGASEQTMTFVTRSNVTVARLGVVVTEQLSQAAANVTLTVPTSTSFNASAFATGSAAQAALAAAVQSAAWQFAAAHCSLGSISFQSSAALCVQAQLMSATSGVTVTTLSVAFNSTLGITAADVGANATSLAALQQDAASCLKAVYTSGLNSTAVNAGLSKVGSAVKLRSWYFGNGTGNATAEVNAQASRCGNVSQAEAQQQWLEASTVALQTDMILLAGEVRCLGNVDQNFPSNLLTC